MTTSSSFLRVLWRPIKGSVVWGGTGVGAGMLLPPYLAKAGLVYSTGLMTTTACGGAIAILLPLGITRGVVSSLQMALVEEGQVGKAVEQAAKRADGMVVLENPKALWETMTWGNTWKGQLVRTVASPFLPSTAQMLTRMQESVDANQADSKVLASAANGLVEGFLQDRKDTLTMVGLLAYGAVLGVGFGFDYSYRRVDEGKAAIKEKAQEKKEAAKAAVEAKAERLKEAAKAAVEDKAERLKEAASRIIIQGKVKENQEARQTTGTGAQEKIKQLKDAASKPLVELQGKFEESEATIQAAGSIFQEKQETMKEHFAKIKGKFEDNEEAEEAFNSSLQETKDREIQKGGGGEEVMPVFEERSRRFKDMFDKQMAKVRGRKGESQDESSREK